MEQKNAADFKLAKQTVLINQEISNQIDEEGYCVVDFLKEKEKQLLLEIFEKFHTVKDTGQGAFMGVISKNIHDALNEILADTLNQWYHNYNTVNAFVVKTPGKSSQVPIHQDVAAIDEEKYSTVNVWIPLQSTNSENGAMHIVPRSHHIFFPYRCATIIPLTKNIESLIYPYFIPLYLEVGQALFFDSRMFHFSPPNLSDQKRIAAVCRIFPKEAKMIAYYKAEGSKDSKIEMWQCADDYLIYKHNYNETERPPNAKLLGYKYANISPMSIDEFEKRREILDILPKDNHASSKAYFETLEQPFTVGFDRT